MESPIHPPRPVRSAPPPLRQGAAAALALAAAALILAAAPASWSVTSWTDPAYDSSGFVVFLVAAALFAWSVTSPVVAARTGPGVGVALGLLGLSALLRLASQLAAVNMLGALCLVLDVYAIGLLCRLPDRARPIAPGWLAAVFAFSLPLERVLQRSLGYALQELSARGACEVLGAFYSDLVCQGVRLIVNGTDVLVDLPCSGARTLLLGLLGYAVAAALCRLSPGRALTGLLVTVVAAALANVLRIAMLAMGIAEPARLGGIDVMAAPWHDLIGLVALSLVILTVVAWAGRCRAPVLRSQRLAATMGPGRPPRLLLGAAALAAAVAIVNLPRTPVDVSAAPQPLALPLALDGQPRREVPLTPREAAYFTRYGGTAAKAEYGPMGLLVTRTTSPLRHLHAPEDCLRGLGFEVAYLGAVFEPLPTALYRAVAPDGRAYRVAVSFVGEDGSATYNVATAVWRWMRGEARVWTAVQRISPEATDPAAEARFSRAVLTALDLGAPDATANWKG